MKGTRAKLVCVADSLSVPLIREKQTLKRADLKYVILFKFICGELEYWLIEQTETEI